MRLAQLSAQSLWIFDMSVANTSWFKLTIGLVPRIVILSISGILILGICVVGVSGYFLERGAADAAQERIDANMRVAWDVLRANGKNFSTVDGKLLAVMC